MAAVATERNLGIVSLNKTIQDRKARVKLLDLEFVLSPKVPINQRQRLELAISPGVLFCVPAFRVTAYLCLLTSLYCIRFNVLPLYVPAELWFTVTCLCSFLYSPLVIY